MDEERVVALFGLKWTSSSIPGNMDFAMLVASIRFPLDVEPIHQVVSARVWTNPENAAGVEASACPAGLPGTVLV
jgi:hypothetical protein